MQTTYPVKIEDLLEQGLNHEQIKNNLRRSIDLIEKGAMYVTINGKKPMFYCDVAGKVTNISLSKIKPVEYIKFEIAPLEQDPGKSVLNESSLLLEADRKGFYFEPRWSKDGEYLSLYQYRIGKQARSYIIEK